LAEKGEIRSKINHRTPAQERRHSRTFGARPDQVQHREERNLARAHAIKDGRVRKGDGMEVDHKRSLARGGSNTKSNTQVLTRHANRTKGTGKAPKK
jgi:5-methylcytosine-specific restriction endonuclease McrA